MIHVASRPFAALALLFAAALLPVTGWGEPLEKPRVAVKTPNTDGVKGRAATRLNTDALVAEMEAALQKSRKFEVLTRQSGALAQIREEQQFADSDLAKGNAATGKLENANYLVLPTVQTFSFYRTTTPIPNIDDKYSRQDQGSIEIQVQVIDTSSGGIKTTFFLKSGFSTRPEVVNTRGGVPAAGHFSTMAKRVAAQLADQLTDTVFPMRVITTKGNQVWINRGKDGGLKKGDLLNVYRPGEELIDPYTGESLGSTEELLGKVKVERINPKYTVTVITGTPPQTPIAQGDILREP
ncbi:FlgT C-terminal domain-containing protein [Endothiovibrio diazotrophicus]